MLKNKKNITYYKPNAKLCLNSLNSYNKQSEIFNLWPDTFCGIHSTNTYPNLDDRHAFTLRTFLLFRVTKLVKHVQPCLSQPLFHQSEPNRNWDCTCSKTVDNHESDSGKDKIRYNIFYCSLRSFIVRNSGW